MGTGPSFRTLKTRKIAMLRSFIRDTDRSIYKPWHCFVKHMLNEHLNGWCKGWQGVMFWKGTQKQGEFGVGRWEAVSPWWREAWHEWIKLDCTLDRNSISDTDLGRWPIWNNRLLAKGHGLEKVLRLHFTNSTTRAHMNQIRKLGFLHFEDFMNYDGNLMKGSELYTAVTVSLSVHGSDYIVPRSACSTLMRAVRALYENALLRWTKTEDITQHQPLLWRIHDAKHTPFTDTNNGTIRRLLESSEPGPREAPRLLRIGQTALEMDWRRETLLLSTLAPSRRDLLRRLLRNGLPLGSKRIHWASHAQTNCLLCDENALETAEHLFWRCPFAKETWKNLHQPWRNHRRNQVTWMEVVKGMEVRIDNQSNAMVEKLWSIIRACAIRTIWFERNRRFFYPQMTTKSPHFRHNQAIEDIATHIAGWIRRLDTHGASEIINIITRVAQTNYDFHLIMSNTMTKNST